MLDERFSAAAFTRLGINTEEARLLANLLADEMLKEIHKVVEPQFSKIIIRLNEMGHNLKPTAISPDELSYRDEWEGDQGSQCKLRVALDLVVSTGYAHLVIEE